VTLIRPDWLSLRSQTRLSDEQYLLVLGDSPQTLNSIQRTPMAGFSWRRGVLFCGLLKVSICGYCFCLPVILLGVRVSLLGAASIVGRSLYTADFNARGWRTGLVSHQGLLRRFLRRTFHCSVLSLGHHPTRSTHLLHLLPLFQPLSIVSKCFRAGTLPLFLPLKEPRDMHKRAPRGLSCPSLLRRHRSHRPFAQLLVMGDPFFWGAPKS
jgi:hypothetical protein